MSAAKIPARDDPVECLEPVVPGEDEAVRAKEEAHYGLSQWRLVWRKFLRSRMAIIGGVSVLLLYLIALFAQFLAPYGGNQRNTAFKVHGHLWEREPYIMPKGFDGDGRLDGPTAVGNNPVSQKIGMQIGFGASNFFDLLFPSAGGAFRVNGDYYYGAQDPISLIPGLWGIMRVQ